MTLIETTTVAFVAAALSAGLGRWWQSQEEAELVRNLAQVRVVAQQYTTLRCTAVPPNPVALADAATELGRPVAVAHPHKWQIVLTPRPGRLGPVATVRYLAQPGDWEYVYLASKQLSQFSAAGVDIAVRRRPGHRTNSSFQLLLENSQC